MILNQKSREASVFSSSGRIPFARAKPGPPLEAHFTV